MSLTPFLQDAVWKTSLGGYPVTYTSVNIKCRFVPKQKAILQANGTMKLSSAIVRCAEAVLANDRIIYANKDSLVLAVNPVIGLGGETIEYEVIL
jgi:hypothetical protein